MKKTLIILIKNFFKFFGYELKGIKPIILHNDYDAIHKFLCDKILKIKNCVIFDVGANDGQSISRFKKVFPNSKIYSFEPDSEIFKKLKIFSQKFRNVKIYNQGLSSKNGQSVFYSYGYDKISSILPLDKNSKLFKSRKLALGQKKNFFKKKKIEIIKLDTFVKIKKIKRINVLKIDVQGFEPEVLRGSSEFLKKSKVDIIELEIILGFGYLKSISFFDIEKNLNKFGYKLISLNYSSNVISFSNYQVDAIYVKHNIFEKIKNIHYKNIDIKNVTKKTNEKNPFSY